MLPNTYVCPFKDFHCAISSALCTDVQFRPYYEIYFNSQIIDLYLSTIERTNVRNKKKIALDVLLIQMPTHVWQTFSSLV